MDTPTPSPSDDFEVETTGPVAPAAPAPVAAPVAASYEAREADDAEPMNDPGDEDQPPPTPKPDKRSVQSRIDRAVAAQREAERRAEAAEQAIAQMRQPREPEPRQPAEPRYTRPKPTEGEIGEKYRDYPEFIEALSDWKDEQRETARAEQRHQHAVAQRHEAHATKFSERIAQAEQANPDYWSQIDPAVANLQPSSALPPGMRPSALNAIADIIFDSEHATELMARLRASDIQRLSTLPPAQLYREMGRLEASVMRPTAAHSGPAARTPAISQAPPPIKPVGSSAAANDVNPLEQDLDVDTHIRLMNARDKRGRFK